MYQIIALDRDWTIQMRSVNSNLSRYNSFDQQLRLNRLENDSPTNHDAPRTPPLPPP